MSDLPELPALPLGHYRHYKGGDYEVIGLARHSETLEPLVVYRPLYNTSGWWVRPYAMFVEQVDMDGRLQPRFARVAEADVVDLAAKFEIDMPRDPAQAMPSNSVKLK